MYVYMYIYIYIERERYRWREGGREGETLMSAPDKSSFVMTNSSKSTSSARLILPVWIYVCVCARVCVL